MRHPERDFRKDHYWHIRNFNASEKLPRSVHARAMSRVQKSRVLEEVSGAMGKISGAFGEASESLGKLPGPLGKELSYRIADKFCSGREGHCFGMSVAAVKEWHERKAKPEKGSVEPKRVEAAEKRKEGAREWKSVAEVRKLSPKMREEILTLHLKQLEPDYLGYVVHLFVKRLLFASQWSMKLIAELIDREGCVLVNVVDVKKLAGHTVVAYDYRKDAKTGDYIIYVADSNHPWSEAEEGTRPVSGALEETKGSGRAKTCKHPSYIRLVRTSDGKKKAGLYYRNRCEDRYEVVFGVPYKYIR